MKFGTLLERSRLQARVAGTLFASLTIASRLWADTVTVTPVAEAELRQLDPDSNFRNADSVVVGTLGSTAGSEIRRAIMQFDLSGKIPSGAVINSATLRVVTVIRIPRTPANSTFDLRRVFAPWTIQEVTWNSRQANSPWQIPGASGPTDAAASASSAIFVTGLGVYTFQSTPALVADIQNWVDHPENNWGWLMRTEAEGTQHTARHFAGQSDPVNAPRLVIVYSLPSLSILTQPMDQDVAVGSTVVFSVLARGTPPLTYQWLFNNTPIIGATNDTMTLESVQSTNAGQYVVTVRDQTGSINSRAARLTVGQGPFVTIVSPTNGARFPLGQQVTVTADADETNGSISQVEFFLNNQSFGISRTNPYVLPIPSSNPGAQQLTAVATDTNQVATTSAVVTISFVGPPTVTETVSPPGTNFLLGTPLTNTALVSAGVTNAAFFADGISLTNFSRPPFVFIWTPTGLGLHSLTISVTDDLGQSNISSPLVIRIHPPDSIPPRIAITNGPANFARLTNATVLIAGVAGDKNLDYVEYQVSSGPFGQLAGPTLAAQGTSNWLALASLLPGNNVIRLRSVDFAGNASAVALRSYIYVVKADLTVRTNGAGIVTPNLNGQSLEVGKVYSLRARAAPGSIFVGWDGFVHQIQSPILNFPMATNLLIVANFTNDFRAAAGSYSGLFFDTTNTRPEGSGSFSLQVMDSGAFSGRIGMSGTSYSFLGKLEPDGTATAAVLRPPLLPTALGFQLDRSGLTNQLVGSVTNMFSTNMLVSELIASRKIPVSRGISPPLAGFVLRNVSDQTVIGTGWLLVTGAGGAHIHARLTDGRSADFTSFLFQQELDGGNLPVFLSFSGGREIIIGLAKIDPNQQTLPVSELWRATSGTNAISTRIELAPN